MVLAAVFIYAPLNMLYILFLPPGRQTKIIYTVLWIGSMFLFEYAGLISGTVVFTGWRAMPWSLVTYILTYAWVYFFYRYLQKKGFDGRQTA
jgi:hypothetical protein